jgi:hypothetical protein
MSSNIAKTLIGVINDQAYRLGIELNKKYTSEQSQFLSKHSIATIYGFDHWCNMIYFINTEENPNRHENFAHVALHPRNTEFTSPEFINFWEDKKINLAKVLKIKPTIGDTTFEEKYNGDELSNYLAKMYGFKSMSEVWSTLKFHIDYKDNYYSLFDCRKKELLINIAFKPENSNFLQEVIVNQLSFGKTLVACPKEWFKYEFDWSTISIAEDFKERDSFYGWTQERLISLFVDEIKDKFGNYISINTAKELLGAIIPIMMHDNKNNGYPISIHSFCEILKLKNLLLIIGDNYYPNEIQNLAKSYLISLGHEFKSTYSTLNTSVQKKHDSGSMLVSHAVFGLSSLFESDKFSISDDLILIDMESIGYYSKYEQKNKGISISNDIISQLALMEEQSMIIIYDSKECPVDNQYIDSIRIYCELKNHVFIIVSNDNLNKFNIKNTINVTKDGEIIEFILE